MTDHHQLWFTFQRTRPERRLAMRGVKRGLLILCLFPILLGAAHSGSVSATRAHQSMTLQATLHGRVLQVTGSGFAPSSRVTVAVIDTRRWQTVFTGSATAEAAIYHCAKGTSVMCMQRDPYAGQLFLEATLRARPSPGILVALYRFEDQIGVRRVRVL